MTDRQAHLEAIKAAPDDDAPRLVYADFLQERGEVERAAYIRDKIADPRPYVFPPGVAAQILTTPDATRGGFVAVELAPALGDLSYTVRRGFVEALACSAADWLAHGDRLTAAHPVREVRLTTFPEWATLTDRDYVYLPDLYLADSARRWPGITFHLPEPAHERRGGIVPGTRATLFRTR